MRNKRTMRRKSSLRNMVKGMSLSSNLLYIGRLPE